MKIKSKLLTVLLGGFLYSSVALADNNNLLLTNNQAVYQSFIGQFISQDGRVIDSSDPRLITTSEGQSYALFFALVNNDPERFAQVFKWTQNNLAEGNLSQNLPAWLWGQDTKTKAWQVLDKNSASDADVWIAYSLLEAGRLWKNETYKTVGLNLLKQIESKEVVHVADQGMLLLPGEYGFVHGNEWKLNPSYSPIQLMHYFAQYSPIWHQIADNTVHMLIQTSPQGFAPDWVTYKDGAWHTKDQKGSYDAIRVYLWTGLLNDQDHDKTKLLNHFSAFAQQTEKNGIPPEKVYLSDLRIDPKAPIGFSAASLPFLKNTGLQQQQFARILAQYHENNTYYNNVLVLFGLGWYTHQYQFNAQGQLVPIWLKAYE